MDFFVITIFLSCIHIICGEVDVCKSAKPLYNVSKRGTGCSGTELTQPVCDRQLEVGWYFAEHDGQILQMPTECPTTFSCGTSGGIWLNGTHPNLPNTTSTIDGCKRGLPTDDNECCADIFPIKVRHCGTFFAYYLQYTTTCDQAYCFGNHICPVTTTVSFPSVTTSTTDTGNDVCQIAKPIGDPFKRGTGCKSTDITQTLCDRQLHEGWYYAKYEDQMLLMPTSCPAMFSCGTAGGIWLNGSHPFVPYTTATLDGCKRGFPTDDNECCSEIFPIQVRHCGHFYAYYLKYTTTCDQAYCFGDHVCPTHTTISRVSTHAITSEVANPKGETPSDEVSDACQIAKSLDNSFKRGTGCLGTELAQTICDRQLPEGWYFAQYGGQMLSMPTACPSMFSCGTAGGIWFNGIHPSTKGTTLTVTGCRRGLPTDDDECCAETFPIKVRHCGSFYAYYLKYTTTCDQAYCFGNHTCQFPTTRHTSTNIYDPNLINSKPENKMHQPIKDQTASEVVAFVLTGIIITITVIVLVVFVLTYRHKTCAFSKKKNTVMGSKTIVIQNWRDITKTSMPPTGTFLAEKKPV